MDYKITDESLARAKELIDKISGLASVPSKIMEAMDAFCVPVEEVEGWVDFGAEFKRDGYLLTYQDNVWKLWALNPFRLLGNTDDIRFDKPKTAQSWADAEIALYEAKQKIAPYQKPKICLKCNFVLPKDYPFELCGLCRPKPEPKPFGPGTRLRAANGDELVVVISANQLFYHVVNLTQNYISFRNYHYPDEVEIDLLKQGAVVIK